MRAIGCDFGNRGRGRGGYAHTGGWGSFSSATSGIPYPPGTHTILPTLDGRAVGHGVFRLSGDAFRQLRRRQDDLLNRP